MNFLKSSSPILLAMAFLGCSSVNETENLKAKLNQITILIGENDKQIKEFHAYYNRVGNVPPPRLNDAEKKSIEEAKRRCMTLIEEGLDSEVAIAEYMDKKKSIGKKAMERERNNYNTLLKERQKLLKMKAELEARVTANKSEVSIPFAPASLTP